jgi:type I restriction enzyme S subunit
MSFTASLTDIVRANSNGLLGTHKSWARVALRDVAQILNGFAFPSSHFNKEHGFPLLRIRDILEDWTETNFRGDFDPQYIVNAGDLVIGMDGDFNSGLWKGQPALLNQRVCKVTTNELFYDLKFLNYVLPGYLSEINQATSAITVKHLSSNTISEIPLPLPPLQEQRRIVARLEELLTQLDAGCNELRKAELQLRRYRQAVLKAALTGELTREWREAHKDQLEPASELVSRILEERRAAWDLTRLARNNTSPTTDGWKREYREPAATVIYNLPKLPEGWTWANISQVGEVTGGLTKNPRREKLPVKIPYLRVANVYAGELDLTEVKSIGIEQSELERVLVTVGDLLVVEGNGSIDQIGRVALWDGKIAPCAHQNHLIKVRFNQPKLGKYIVWWLLSSEGRNFITSVASSTSGLHTLSISKVASLPLPLPPILEQEQIVCEIERALSIADVMQEGIDIASRQAERLRQSILKQAFEGKLVSQDPNDEPAERLLERIKTERAKREAEKQAEAKSNRKGFTRKRLKRTERPAA